MAVCTVVGQSQQYRMRERRHKALHWVLSFHYKFKNLQKESTVSAVRGGHSCRELIDLYVGLKKNHIKLCTEDFCTSCVPRFKTSCI